MYIAKTDAALENEVLSRFSKDSDKTPEGVSKILGSLPTRTPIPLAPVSVGDIENLFRPFFSSRPPTIYLHIKQDAFYFGSQKPELIKNSILQVASQFNFLESVNSDHMALTDYYKDRTQGPKASLGCPGMLVQRDGYFQNAENQKKAQPIFEGFDEKVYKGGYFTPSHINPEHRQEALEHLRANIKTLNILAQSGKSLWDTAMIQVFTAAPSFQGEMAPLYQSTRGQMCDLLVSTQYEALGRLAALHSMQIKQTVQLHITLVGQGAFNNPKQVMANSFEKLLEALRGYDVVVHVHAFGPKDVEIAKLAIKEAGRKLGFGTEFNPTTHG